MPSKPRLFACPSCGRERETVVRLGLCTACYERSRPPRQRKSRATCADCGEERLANFRRGLCPRCYERQRRGAFTCMVCSRLVEAPASFVALGVCPCCWSRGRVVEAFTCPVCGETKRTRPHGGICRACYERRRIRVATCSVCGQTRETAMDGDICHACTSAARSRRKGIAPAPQPEPPEVTEERLVASLAPLRRPWVREFLASGYRRRSRKTRQMYLRALGRFDAYLATQADVGEGQWSLVGPEHVQAYLAVVGRFHLQSTKAFFSWLQSRKRIDRAVVAALPDPPKLVRLRVIPAEQVAACYRRWTTVDAHPPAALVGLLALVHCLRKGEIRFLRMADVLGLDRLRVGERVVHLADPVADALTRYLTWRARTYAGPSTYLLVSRASRLHDRPVSNVWFQDNLLGGISVASLRQTAIQWLVQTVGCDGLQVAAHTDLSLDAVGVYLRTFGHPTA